MSTSRLDPEILDRLVAAVRGRHPSAAGIWLFGSHARGRARDDSDVDLCVLRAPGHVDEPPIALTALTLGEVAGADVDLVDVADADTVLRREMLCLGERVWTGDRRTCEAAEARARELYASWYEERYVAYGRGRGAYGRGRGASA